MEEARMVEIFRTKVKKPKTPKIVCLVDGELIAFKDEAAVKKMMWSERPEQVIMYTLVGAVEVPFDLAVSPVKR